MSFSFTLAGSDWKNPKISLTSPSRFCRRLSNTTSTAANPSPQSWPIWVLQSHITLTAWALWVSCIGFWPAARCFQKRWPIWKPVGIDIFEKNQTFELLFTTYSIFDIYRDTEPRDQAPHSLPYDFWGAGILHHRSEYQASQIKQVSMCQRI